MWLNIRQSPWQRPFYNKNTTRDARPLKAIVIGAAWKNARPSIIYRRNFTRVYWVIVADNYWLHNEPVNTGEPTTIHLEPVTIILVLVAVVGEQRHFLSTEQVAKV